MAIQITSIVRENPPPCRHFAITVTDDDGLSFTTRVRVKDPATDLPKVDRDAARQLVLTLLSFYVNRKGLNLNDLIGKEIVKDVL